MKITWSINNSLDLLRRCEVWPDSIENGKELLNHTYKYIEGFIGDGEKIKLNKLIIKKSFDKNYL